MFQIDATMIRRQASSDHDIAAIVGEGHAVGTENMGVSNQNQTVCLPC
jgi:hypothetical protein